MGFSMGQTQYTAKDRGRRRQTVDALCPIGDEELKRISKYSEVILLVPRRFGLDRFNPKEIRLRQV